MQAMCHYIQWKDIINLGQNHRGMRRWQLFDEEGKAIALREDRCHAWVHGMNTSGSAANCIVPGTGWTCLSSARNPGQSRESGKEIQELQSKSTVQPDVVLKNVCAITTWICFYLWWENPWESQLSYMVSTEDWENDIWKGFLIQQAKKKGTLVRVDFSRKTASGTVETWGVKVTVLNTFDPSSFPGASYGSRAPCEMVAEQSQS